jgi:hypothetical protein
VVADDELVDPFLYMVAARWPGAILSGTSNSVQYAILTSSWALRGTFANRFLARCSFCRRRQKIRYIDLLIVPTWVVNPLVVGASRLVRSA